MSGWVILLRRLCESFGILGAPEFYCILDLLGLAGRREFPGQRHFGFEVLEKLVVWQAAGEGDAVVAVGPLHVVQVGANKIGFHLGEPLVVIEEAEIVLQANVAEVVPVADLRAVREVFLKGDHFSFVGDVFVFGA